MCRKGGACMVKGGMHGKRGACLAWGCAWHRGYAWQGGVRGKGGCAGETVTEADSTHPTGMDSCLH